MAGYSYTPDPGNSVVTAIWDLRRGPPAAFTDDEDTQICAPPQLYAEDRYEPTALRLEPFAKRCERTEIAPIPEPPRRMARGSEPPAPRAVGSESDCPERPRLGDYEVLRRIAGGGMGVVYEGRHVRLGRRVAIKCMRKSLLDRPELTRRFLGEAVAGSVVRHPGVVQVLDYGYDDEGAAYLVMEYLDGDSLAARLASGRLSPEEAIGIAAQLAETLGAAHEAGVVHRDIKPDNVFLVEDPAAPGGRRVKILDFGVAKFLRDEGVHPLQTRLGKILGTPCYMSPEQSNGSGRIDARSDIYSLGCVLYQMACGRPPFQGSLGEVLSAHIYERPTPPRAFEPLLPVALEAVILRMLAKRPSERPQSMAEVERALASVLERSATEPSLADDLEPARAMLPPLDRAGSAPPGVSRTVVRQGAGHLRQRRRRRLTLVVALLLCLVAVALAGAVSVGALEMPFASAGRGSSVMLGACEDRQPDPIALRDHDLRGHVAPGGRARGDQPRSGLPG